MVGCSPGSNFFGTFTLYCKTIEFVLFRFLNFCENYCELSCKSFSMATSFNAGKFMSEPDQDVFDSLRKNDLLALSLYLNLNDRNHGVRLTYRELL